MVPFRSSFMSIDFNSPQLTHLTIFVDIGKNVFSLHHEQYSNFVIHDYNI